MYEYEEGLEIPDSFEAGEIVELMLDQNLEYILAIIGAYFDAEEEEVLTSLHEQMMELLLTKNTIRNLVYYLEKLRLINVTKYTKKLSEVYLFLIEQLGFEKEFVLEQLKITSGLLINSNFIYMLYTSYAKVGIIGGTVYVTEDNHVIILPNVDEDLDDKWGSDFAVIDNDIEDKGGLDLAT